MIINGKVFATAEAFSLRKKSTILCAKSVDTADKSEYIVYWN